MRFRSGYLTMAGVIIALGVAPGGAQADEQETTISVVASGPAAGLLIGFRTSDPGASFVSCALSGSVTSCSQVNMNGSTKNIGNILCLPAAYSTYQATASCQSLLGAPAGSCQQNSSIGKCPSGLTPVMPFCNYRTSSNMATVASWNWEVTLSASPGGASTVDCQNPGYAGTSP